MYDYSGKVTWLEANRLEANWLEANRLEANRPKAKSKSLFRSLLLIILFASHLPTLTSAQSKQRALAHSTSNISKHFDPNQLQFELIYVAPGNGTYSLFGHLAMRVKDKRKDRIFDLGITSSVGLKGLKDIALGKALFHGEARSFPYMLKSWQRRDRSVIAYPLNLSSKQKQNLLRELESRLKGVAKPYLYDPLRANCATQLRQALEDVSEGLLTRQISHQMRNYTFRSDTRDGYAQEPGVLIAIELIVGHSLDQIRSPWDSSYRPIHLVEELKHIRLDGHMLLDNPKYYYIRQAPNSTGGYLYYYLNTGLMITVFLLGLLCWRKQRKLCCVETLEISVKVSSTLLSWIGFYLASILLIILFSLAIYISMVSEWIEVRNSWLLLLGSPMDILLLSFGPWSSVSYRTWLGDLFKLRIVVSLVMTLIFSIFLTTLPTITLILIMFLLWGACLFVLSGLGSPFQVSHQFKVTKESMPDVQGNDISWMDG